jgi:hypothetical protein
MNLRNVMDFQSWGNPKPDPNMLGEIITELFNKVFRSQNSSRIEPERFLSLPPM